jgi:Transglutaminase-like superfamily
MLRAISMSRVRKFFRLPHGERWLLLKAALLLGAIRIGLRLLAFQTLKQLLDSASQPRSASEFSSDQIVWAVIAASRYVLGDKPCLVQALAVQLLLKRRGYPASLRIGVARKGRGELQAHAWVESEDSVVIGGGDLSRYKPFSAFDGESNKQHYSI